MMLTPHFSLGEFTRSSTASRLGVDNTPPPELLCNLWVLCASVLEPLRLQVGRLQVTSGYRSPRVNAAVGSTSRSQHLIGEAADVKPMQLPKGDVLKLLWHMSADRFPIDQVIVYAHTMHLHVSVTTRREPRGQFLVKSSTGYTDWSLGDSVPGPSLI